MWHRVRRLVKILQRACVAAAAISFQPHWRLRPVQRSVAAGAALAALLAMLLFAGSIGSALAPLAGLTVGVGGTLGTMQLVAGVLLGLVVVSARALELALHRLGRPV